MSHTKNYGSASISGMRKGKRIGLLATICAMLLCSIVFLAACSREKLATPTNLEIDEAMRLTWSMVDNSTGGYHVEVNGDGPYLATETMYRLDSLNLGVGTHTIRVKALTKDSNYFVDSEWSDPIDFPIQEKTAGLSYRLINNGSEYEVLGTGNISGDIIVGDTFNGKPITRIGDSAFAQSANLTSIKFGKNIRETGYQSFFNCTNLASITLNEGLESIGVASFLNCIALAEISFPSTLKTISDRAFITCNTLTEVEIPSSVEYLGERAFERCAELKKVVIGDGITILYHGTFYKCEKLEDVTLSNNLTYITWETFSECISLAEIIIPESMETIEFGSFAKTAIFKNSDELVYTSNETGKWLIGFNEDILTNITVDEPEYLDISIDDGTKGIGNAALRGLINMRTVDIPESVTKIGMAAFYECFSLLEVTVPSKVTELASNTFAECRFLEKVNLKEGLKRIGVTAFANCDKLTKAGITLPGSIDSIGENAFLNTGIYKNPTGTNKLVYVGNWLVNYIMVEPDANGERHDTRTSITLANNTVGISDYALSWFSSLTKVNLVPTLEYIGVRAFANCTGLTSLPEFEDTNVTRLPDESFLGCKGLTLIEIPEEITSIGNSVFEGSGIFGVTSFPSRVDTISHRLFAKTNMFEFDVPSTVTTIESEAFVDCMVLQSVTIPDSVTEIGASAFQSCVSLTSINLPKDIKVISDFMFRKCSKLTEITIPEGVEVIGSKAFMGCDVLESIEFPSSVVEIGGQAFQDCGALSSIVIPDTVKTIGNYAFAGCSDVRTASIGSGITGISVGMFENCSLLAAIEIPDTISSIGDYAFTNCSRLSTVIISKNIINMGTNVFRGTNVTIYSETDNANDWNTHWNSTNRPVFWGCALAKDSATGSFYVVSFTKRAKSITNPNDFTLIMPVRQGYTFRGWNESPDGSGANYSTIKADDNTLNGTTLYTTWRASGN